MTEILELIDKNFKLAIIKMHFYALETNDKIRSPSKKNQQKTITSSIDVKNN